MVIHIANKKVDAMVRKLAAERGLTLGATVHMCVQAALERDILADAERQEIEQPALEQAKPDTAF